MSWVERVVKYARFALALSLVFSGCAPPATLQVAPLQMGNPRHSISPVELW